MSLTSDKNTDTLIINAVVVDGTGASPYEGSLLIADGRIKEIRREPVRASSLGSGASSKGASPENDAHPDLRIIDAGGSYVTPGFIDIHRHGDWRALLGQNGGDDELLSRQGVTTVVNGNCGLSVAPVFGPHADEIRHFIRSVTGMKPDDPALEEADRDLESYYKALSSTPRTVNSGMLTGNGTIRANIAGFHPGELTDDEKKRIRSLLEKELASGALGVSLGLGYAPEFEYNAKGLIEVLEPIRNTDIPITTHIRSEGDGSYESVEEVISVAEGLNIPLHLCHMKCIGKRNWHAGPERELALIHRKKAEGLKIDFDLYPYQVGSTQLLHVIPPAFQTGGIDHFLAGLRVRKFRDALTKALKTPSHDFENIVELVGLENVAAASLFSERFRPYSGQSITEIAEAFHEDPYETLYDILSEEKCEVTMLDTVTCEDDLIRFYSDPDASVISDAIYPDTGKLHPRVAATYPHFLIRFVRELKIFPIEEAIRKMTSAPAAVLKIDRGTIKEGAAADLCIFDLNDLDTPATYSEPERLATGFQCVMVNGQTVVENDTWIPGCPGTVIKRA